LEFREGRPVRAVLGNGGQSRAVGLLHQFPGRVVKGHLFEGFFLGFAGGAYGALVALAVYGLGS
jgi:hypothetical protein